MAKNPARKSRTKKIDPGESSSPPQPEYDDNLWHDPFVHVVLIIATAFFVYFNTVTIPFMFDDFTYLVNNPAIKDFSYFRDSNLILKLGINEDVKNNFILRPLSYFSFAINYALHGLDVRGYHIVNLLIHIVNSLLVYTLLLLALKTPAMVADEQQQQSDSPAEKWRYLPLFCALLFVCHPLQTQAVNYIIQRFTPLVAMFYLGSLVLYLAGRLSTTKHRTTCYVLSVIVAILAMKTKENAFTLPIIIALFEFIYFTGSIVGRIVKLVPFLLTMAIIPFDIITLASQAQPDDTDTIIDAINLVNFRGVFPLDYLMTQFGVITTYLRLLVVPIGQNIDYDYPLQKIFISPAVLLPLGLLLLLLGAGIYALYRSKDRHLRDHNLCKIIAFGIFWFFITLAVESSIIPIDDLIFEHRAYLPSIGIFMSLLAAIALAYGRLFGESFFASKAALRTLGAVILCLSVTSIMRNSTWTDEVAFWSDAASKSPNKSRVHTSLGIALLEKGKTIEGIEEFRTALKLNAKKPTPRINLGKALLSIKRYEEAATELQTAARLYPNSPLPHLVLGQVHESKGDLTNAKWAYLAAIKLSPALPEAHIRLGELYAKEKKIREALIEYEVARQLYPDENVIKRIAELSHRQGKPLRP